MRFQWRGGSHVTEMLADHFLRRCKIALFCVIKALTYDIGVASRLYSVVTTRTKLALIDLDFMSCDSIYVAFRSLC